VSLDHVGLVLGLEMSRLARSCKDWHQLLELCGVFRTLLRLEQHWQQRRERAAIEAERAARQYAAVEPENRLVARELERRWEAALGQQRQVEEAYDRFCQEQPAELTAAQREAILRLAEDVPHLWHARTTTPQDRQEILRLLLEQVTVAVEGESEQVAVTLHWAGGQVSHHRLIRPVARYEQLSYYGPLRARVAALQAQGRTSPEIARHLNAEGFLPPKTNEAVHRSHDNPVPHR
jgi:hypothetical protein